MRCCNGCGVLKEATAFHAGHRTCKSCRSARDREYREQGDNAERARARSREWYRQNAAALAERRTETVESRKGENALTKARRRGARRAEFVAPLVVLELHDGVCGICGEDVDPLAYDLDHIIPVPHGGSHNVENLQPAHPRCNKLKGSTLQEVAA